MGVYRQVVADYSDIEIGALISCRKTISEPPAKHLKLVGADWRNNAKLTSAEGIAGSFSVFIRKNEDLPENFSIGLVYHSVDGRPEVTLLRCNGKHGTFTGQGDAAHPHWTYHIHRASEEAQGKGFTPEKYASPTTEYASFEEALQHFVKTVNLDATEAARYFPDDAQGKLFVN